MVLNNYDELKDYFTKNKVNDLFVVCFDIIKEFAIYDFLEKLSIKKDLF